MDSPVRRPDPETEEGVRGRAFRKPGVYPDLATALGHFRLVPEQPAEHRYIIDHIARHSLHETAEGGGQGLPAVEDFGSSYPNERWRGSTLTLFPDFASDEGTLNG